MLKELDARLETLGVPPGSLLVLARRRDERLVEVTLPDARVRRIGGGLSRTQWFEFASAFLGLTAVCVLMGAVHLATGLAVQAVMTLAAVVGLVLYHRRPQVEKHLVGPVFVCVIVWTADSSSRVSRIATAAPIAATTNASSTGQIQSPGYHRMWRCQAAPSAGTTLLGR